MRLYPKVKVIGKSFEGVKSAVVPNQSMSLREIVRRFVRRESLPVEKQGIYEERFGDLEKLSKEDIVTQMDKVEELKGHIEAFNKRQRDREEKAKAAAAAKATTTSPVQGIPPDGVTPVKTPTP